MCYKSDGGLETLHESVLLCTWTVRRITDFEDIVRFVQKHDMDSPRSKDRLWAYSLVMSSGQYYPSSAQDCRMFISQHVCGVLIVFALALQISARRQAIMISSCNGDIHKSVACGSVAVFSSAGLVPWKAPLHIQKARLAEGQGNYRIIKEA